MDTEDATPQEDLLNAKLRIIQGEYAVFLMIGDHMWERLRAGDLPLDIRREFGFVE